MTANTLRYHSTRGGSPALGFDDVLLAGLAPDGGLYVPTDWPTLMPGAEGRLTGAAYSDVAADVIGLFTDPAEHPALALDIRAAYGRFAHPAVAPLFQVGADDFLLELHHGPTLAFKDVAMQLLGPLFARVLRGPWAHNDHCRCDLGGHGRCGDRGHGGPRECYDLRSPPAGPYFRGAKTVYDNRRG